MFVWEAGRARHLSCGGECVFTDSVESPEGGADDELAASGLI